MDEVDRAYFEKDLLAHLLAFIEDLVILAENRINYSSFEYYVRITSSEFMDEVDEEEKVKGDELFAMETSHFILLFLFDML